MFPVIIGAIIVSVTNHAGCVMTGPFGGITNGTFAIASRVYPLSVLPASERHRLGALAGCDVRTPAEKVRARERAHWIDRIRIREEMGEITPETAARLRAEIPE